ncbi:response regulator transcription factor [Herbiconiux sp. CPCC 205763]|uniref:Response regulator transcription factor n=1 Tax=Herbiconiux aconitum TaxID=2970913 RepID=A0ABT2GLA3_9MICO|nr:response regulator transcription factor [Herbiconiux aconitum]MCS5716994.1 response regulator transcription factor [Herbiconiux aconitum]
MKILIADDDPQILRALRITLGSQGYDIVTAVDGADAIRVATEGTVDLIMLDLGMPRLNGLEVIQAVRGWSSVPILVVSGRAGSADKVDALDAGADDYVTKPFAMDELLARIRALTRRSGPGSTGDEPAVTFSGITVDLAAHQVMRHGDRTAIRLTPTEWKILELLVRNPGRLVTHQELLTEVWGTHLVKETGYLRLYIGQLRKKLEAEPSHPVHFLTEAGMGYRFVPDPTPVHEEGGRR